MPYCLVKGEIEQNLTNKWNEIKKKIESSSLIYQGILKSYLRFYLQFFEFYLQLELFTTVSYKLFSIINY